MARYSEASEILAAANRWKTDCLLKGGSIFSDHRLWNSENFTALREYFVENPQEGKGSFLTKLKKQLEPAPASATQLAAELFWVMYLVVHESSMSGQTKRFQIKRVWEWSGKAFPEHAWAAEELLEKGVANPGIAYHTHRWREVRFFITTGCDWYGLDLAKREELLSDPWAFASWLEARKHAKGRQFRHALLFLLFPDHFERILTGTHKRDIVRKFSDSLDQEVQIDYKDRIALDQAVLKVREHLEAEASEGEVDFYLPHYRKEWHPDDEDPNGDGPDLPEETEAETWYRKRFGDVRTWALSPGEGARFWPEFKREGIAAVGWDDLGDLTEYTSKEEIREGLIELQGASNPIMDTLALWQWANEIQPGDVIVAKRGRSGLVGWGKVTGKYEYDPSRAEYQHVLPVEWHAVEPVDLPRDRWITNKTLTDFTDYKPWLKFAFSLMEGEEREPPTEDRHIGIDPYTLNHALQDLFLTKPEFAEILDSIGRWKNLILQGPPGVGKTFIATRIAWTLIGRQDPELVQMVQFHQSYSYEDFIQGWRPTKSGGFTLRNGIFYQFCKKAEKSLDTPHVFIIDEINRGNLSRIFGELMMLIEPDKRGPNHALPLTYSEAGARFSVPPNVHILGMMNTADRSLAMVDYALRRRFAFYSLEPAFGKEPFHSYLLEAEIDEDLVQLIDDRMIILNERIRRDRKNLGPGFEIGHSYFVPSGDEESLDKEWYRGVIRSQVEPLLREYWFDQGSQVDEFVGELLA